MKLWSYYLRFILNNFILNLFSIKPYSLVMCLTKLGIKFCNSQSANNQKTVLGIRIYYSRKRWNYILSSELWCHIFGSGRPVFRKNLLSLSLQQATIYFDTLVPLKQTWVSFRKNVRLVNCILNYWKELVGALQKAPFCTLEA